MATYKYAFRTEDHKSIGRAFATNLSISLKKSVEVCRAIRGRKVKVAIDYLEGVTKQKTVVPYRRYRAEMGHKKGKRIDTGGFPVNVALDVLKLLKSAEKNAKENDVSGDLYVTSASARKGVGRYHPGRYAGRAMKATHVEVVVGVRDKKKVETKEVAKE